WVEAQSTEGRVAIAATGSFNPSDVIATLVVDAAENGDVTFTNVKVGDNMKGVLKTNVLGATTGSASLTLSQNTPNPFVAGTSTSFGYLAPSDGRVLVRVFDVLGREVRTLVDANVAAGWYQTE